MNKHKTKHKNKYTHLMFFCVTFFSICFSFTTMINVHAINSSISVSVADIIELNILPTIGGSFASSTASNNVSVKTDNGTGYELGIKAGTEGSNSLTRAGGGSIPSLSIVGGINEDTYRTNSDYNNTWGFKPSKYNSSANSNYLPAPSSASTTTVLDKTSTSNPSTYNDYTINIGSRVASGTPSGSYSNTFVFTVTANPAIYSITYNANGTSVSNMPANISNQTTSSETVNISSTVPTRSNYTFEGWCTVQVADGTACSGTSYAAGSTWTIDKTAASSSLTLYARWKVAKLYIQDLTLSACQRNVGTGGNPANIGDNITVYDRRDENDYTVRYINGECWMTQNLRITGTVSATYSNFNSGSFDVSKYDITNTTYCTSSPAGFNNACSHDSGDKQTGRWYNYASATAGTITGNQNSTSATQDICPSGWHLPTAPSTTIGTDGNRLIGNTTRGYRTPANDLTTFGAIAGGYYLNGSASNTNYGYWWSSSADDNSNRYTLSSLPSSNLYSAEFKYSRYIGMFVRCVKSS